MNSESEVSEPDDDDTFDESLLDRLAALQDMVPPSYRKTVANITSTGYSWASSAVSLSGKTLWVVSTSALLLGVPWALAFSEEQQVQEMEREMRMQQSANEVSDLRSGETVVDERADADGCTVVDAGRGYWTAASEAGAVRRASACLTSDTVWRSTTSEVPCTIFSPHISCKACLLSCAPLRSND